MTWKNSVCMISPQPSIFDPQRLIVEEVQNKLSAIDKYYQATRPALVDIQSAYFAAYPKEITNLLYVALITATENYFRDILGFIIQTCPSSKSFSAEEKVQLGSFLWGIKDFHSRSAFEFAAFSASKNVSETVKKFTGHVVKQAGLWSRMLIEFDKLCEIRHAIVHSGHIVAGKNAIKLNLRKTEKLMRVNVDFVAVQDAGSICTTLVQAANNELFEVLACRWAEDWRRLNSWEPADEKILFNKILKGFMSERDYDNRSILNRLSQKRIYSEIRIAFNLP